MLRLRMYIQLIAKVSIIIQDNLHSNVIIHEYSH
uniref:Metallopeptidase n=1 Tax=Myoviridae sp. ctJ2i1 TaxID=2825079 RepID=A0A8S5V1R4_9CAUD|nr:MAG TPA: metallopeptidase [Myoviridae sp. ctJ2i1]